MNQLRVKWFHFRSKQNFFCTIYAHFRLYRVLTLEECNVQPFLLLPGQSDRHTLCFRDCSDGLKTLFSTLQFVHTIRGSSVSYVLFNWIMWLCEQIGSRFARCQPSITNIQTFLESGGLCLQKRSTAVIPDIFLSDVHSHKSDELIVTLPHGPNGLSWKVDIFLLIRELLLMCGLGVFFSLLQRVCFAEARLFISTFLFWTEVRIGWSDFAPFSGGKRPTPFHHGPR